MLAEIFIDTTATVGRLDRRVYGQFVEHLGRCIYGGIWVGEESRIPNIKGFRKDVLDAVRALRPPIIRWPGGNFSSGYHWEDGIGPRDKRPRKFDMAWGAEEPNEFGTDEYIEWCRMVDAEPFIVVNAGNGTPEEAAKWVEYCNSSGDTQYASLRKKYGHPEPYQVRLWGIGNELYGRWQIGFCIDGKECARRTIEFANQMRKVDPNIELIAVGCEDPEWNLEMVKLAGNYFDYLSIHMYVNGSKPYRELVAIPRYIERKLRAVYDLVEAIRKRQGIKKKIEIAFDEWNVWYPEAKPPLHEQVTTVKDAIFTALVLNGLHRLCKEVTIACFAQTVNVLPLISTRDNGVMFVNPQYLVFKMYGNNTGDQVLKVVTYSQSYYSKELDSYVSFIDATATASRDKRTIYLHVVNRHEEETFKCRVALKGWRPLSVKWLRVSGDSLNACNTFDEPNRVQIEISKKAKVEGDQVVCTLPPHSVNVLILRGTPYK